MLLKLTRDNDIYTNKEVMRSSDSQEKDYQNNYNNEARSWFEIKLFKRLFERLGSNGVLMNETKSSRKL